jgi:hypothetical protein
LRQMQLMDSDVGWQLDKKNSIARLEIKPERRGDEVLFRYNSTIQIKPYPNPFSYGGEWSNGAVETEAEVDQVIADFHKRAARWEKYGIKVEVVRHPETRKHVYPAQMQLE